MTPAARVQAAIELLDLILIATRDDGAAADSIINQWFRARRFAGSKDRRSISDLVYRAIRAYGNPPETGRAAVLGLGEFEDLFDGSTHGPSTIIEGEPRAVRSLVPKWLESRIPPEEWPALLERAPLDLRVNLLRASVEQAKVLFPDASALPHIPAGLRLADHQRLTPEQEAVAEVQDAGSQWVAQSCAIDPDDLVIDLCAGAGGKTLALAAQSNNRARIIACDTDRGRLSRLMPRAEKAGATTIETRLLNPTKELEVLGDMLGKADYVLVDAPCSGTGTWRRNPELRWRLNPKRLERVVKLQMQILAIAEKLVKPGGRLIYAVCSILPEEGEAQMQAFAARNDGWKALTNREWGQSSGLGQILTPAQNSCDGFFFATLTKSC